MFVKENPDRKKNKKTSHCNTYLGPSFHTAVIKSLNSSPLAYSLQNTFQNNKTSHLPPSHCYSKLIASKNSIYSSTQTHSRPISNLCKDLHFFPVILSTSWELKITLSTHNLSKSPQSCPRISTKYLLETQGNTSLTQKIRKSL